LLREPLVHFALAGLALFVLYDMVSPGDAGSNRIVVSREQVDDLAAQYETTWNRRPSPAELDALVETFVRDEIAYREGLAMGLADEDAVIKRRVRQKYDIMAEEGDGRSEPSEAELEAYLKAHPETFRRAAVVSFEQVFFDPALSSPETVAAVKRELGKGTDGAGLGQPTMLPRRVEAMSLELVARDFGAEFARQLETAPLGTWVGPLASGIGVHLVRVDRRIEPALPPLADVRDAVAREWENDRRVRNRDAEYARLRADYEVVLPEPPRLAARP
jgi:hypothetical protein